MDIDDIFIKTGELGKFQKGAFICLCLSTVYCGTQMVHNIFQGYKHKLHCKSDGSFNYCDTKCEPVFDDPFLSFVNEWDMFCGSAAAKVDSVQSIFMLGVMIGSFIMGFVSDRYGRFPVLIGCGFMSPLFALISAFAQSWNGLVALRFLTGFFMSGLITVGFVLTSELVGPSKRSIVGTIPALTFAMGICLLSFTAWMTQNWRYMSAILGAAGFLMNAPSYWFYLESPRWYLGNGNTEKCQQILQKITQINGFSLGKIDVKVPHRSSETAGSVKDLYRNRILLKLTLIQLFSWFTVSTVYYGLTLASGDMGENHYVSVILSSLAEMPSNIIIIYLMNSPRLGRVRSNCIGLVLSSILCCSVWIVPAGYKNTTVALACGGKFFICFSFAVIYVQAAEIYPTTVRNNALGILSVFNRIGGVFAPLFVGLERYAHNSHFVLYGILGLLCGILSLQLPETLGRALPDVPEDLYAQVRKIDSSKIPLRHSEDNKGFESTEET